MQKKKRKDPVHVRPVGSPFIHLRKVSNIEVEEVDDLMGSMSMLTA